MTNQEVGDPIFGLATRVEKAEHDIQNIYGKLMRAFVGSRIVAGNIAGVIPPGVVIGPTIVNLINNSGGSLDDGDVVVLDPTLARSVTTTTDAGDDLVIGVVRDVNNQGPFANGSETPIQVDGFVALLNVTGAVTAGDWLVTSATVKLAESVGATPSAGVFAYAMSADVAGAVNAYILGGVPGGIPAPPSQIAIESFDGSPTIATPTLIQVPNGTLSQPSAGVAVIDQRPVFVTFDASGLTDGVETDFRTPDFFQPDSAMVWEDGLLLRPVVDYMEDADFGGVTLTSAPPAATALLIRYEAAT